MASDPAPDLMAPREVAALFGVTSSAVAAWADDGKLEVRRTPGGQRRYVRADVDRLYAESVATGAGEAVA